MHDGVKGLERRRGAVRAAAAEAAGDDRRAGARAGAAGRLGRLGRLANGPRCRFRATLWGPGDRD